MRRLVLAAWALAGCSSELGLRIPVPFDGRPPPACPPTGAPLQLSDVIHQALVQDCFSYAASVSTGVAIASCVVPTAIGSATSWGPIDGPLVSANLVPPTGETLGIAALAPEGDELLVTSTGTTAGLESFMLRDGSWVDSGRVAVPAPGNFSAPTRRPNRHMVVD